MEPGQRHCDRADFITHQTNGVVSQHRRLFVVDLDRDSRHASDRGQRRTAGIDPDLLPRRDR